MKPLSESALEACRAVSQFISRDVTSQHVRDGLLLDLLWKSRDLGDQSRAVALAQGSYYFLPAYIRQLFPDKDLGVSTLHQLPPWSRSKQDVGILTILKQELDAVLSAIDVQADMPVSVGGVDIWLGRIPRRRQRPLTVVVTRVGKPRNVPMAMRVQTLMSFFDIGTLALMGISAGFEGKIALGDVVVADRVYDYEHVRSELLGQTVVERPRPLILEVPLRVTSDLDLFEVHSMKNKYRELTRRQDLQKSPGGKGWKTPRLDRGTIAAGERLLADGSLSLMRERMDNRILAGNQEDSGFAQAAELAKVPWCIFRGISDYGDPAKPVGNEWHFAASLAAAAAGVSFFQYAYRPQDDGPF